MDGTTNPLLRRDREEGEQENPLEDRHRRTAARVLRLTTPMQRAFRRPLHWMPAVDDSDI